MDNKILLVTGASSDIGTAYIKRYSDRYDKIVGTYYTCKEGLEELQKEIGNKLEIYRLNLLEQDEIDRFCAYLTEHNLLPNYVMHLPAQRPAMARTHELESSVLRSDLEISVVAFLRLLRPILSSMSEKKFGRICCMLSSVTKNAIGFQSSYMVSKYALLGAVKALAVEYAGKRITVNAVSPSMTDTKFIAETSAYVVKKNIERNPMRRLVKPDEVIRAFSFLLEYENEYITGENLLVAGGGIIS